MKRLLREPHRDPGCKSQPLSNAPQTGTMDRWRLASLRFYFVGLLWGGTKFDMCLFGENVCAGGFGLVPSRKRRGHDRTLMERRMKGERIRHFICDFRWKWLIWGYHSLGRMFLTRWQEFDYPICANLNSPQRQFMRGVSGRDVCARLDGVP